MKGLLETVVVAVSGSEASINAAKYGIALAKLYHCRLLAVYVVDTATLKELLLSRIFVPEESEEYQKSLQRNGRRYLDYVAELARKKGVELEPLLREGAVSTEVIETADENDASMILLGGFEEKGNIRDALSRHHREILRNARCSVLFVKGPNVDFLYRRL